MAASFRKSHRRRPVGAGAAALALVGAGILLQRVIGRRRKYDLSGKTVVITGGSRGLGLVLAREFGGLGARVAICARNQEQLNRAAEELRSRGIETYAFT